ncbi:(5-formylfuran-3-yl)methyl phosphate synthase [Methyloligella solikamskensis]|uniref:(5-formylfuran-3-yl)methyl phosphate synthase n=1 Tax=Methyloligella solikamskensis TaxID=1177756 RepID=A0ABW3JCP5_9HYPH
MTQFLASVRGPEEAEIALRAGADIIDLKEPDRGALGAVPYGVLVETVRRIAGRAEVSATVGDLPMDPDVLEPAIARTAEAGVDYVKFGVFAGETTEACLRALHPALKGAKLILVLFADDLPDCDVVGLAADMGAAGVMLDTRHKGSGHLLSHMDRERLAAFIVQGRRHGLRVGLAGSLRKEHVDELLSLGPDLLGFRGALCEASLRGGALSEEAVREIRGLIPKEPLEEPLASSRVNPALSADGASPIW